MPYAIFRRSAGIRTSWSVSRPVSSAKAPGPRTGGAVALPNASGPGGSNNSIFQTENQIPIVANGQRTSQNNFEIDGVSVNSLTWGGAAVVTPNQESVKSIRVASSDYSAEAGRNSGAQIEVVSQNGTNQFHGSGVFKYNDPLFNAFNKFGGPNGAPPVRVAAAPAPVCGQRRRPHCEEQAVLLFLL